jgi:hypothetical protein
LNYERTPTEVQTAILLRMAASREALLVANRAPLAVPAVRVQTRSAVASVVTSLTDAPRVTLLLALCVGAILLGPRRTVSIVGRSGIAAWLGLVAQKAIARDV